jgi:LmbE family N-acetylglucosaminyl deacetylase
MRVRAFLDHLRALPIADPEALTNRGPFIVLSPHPDDESLGCGGLIASACAIGQSVDIVVLTDGTGSHTSSESYPPPRLARLRKAEAAAAARHLGLGEEHLSHLDLPDARAPLHGPAFEAAVDALHAIAERSRAATLFTTWGGDPHCDHEAADQMARALRRRMPALALWSYPIWGWHLPPDDAVDAPPPVGYRIDVTPWQAAKRAAIAAHASQMTALIADDPQGFRFDHRTIAPFIGRFEYFFEVPA